MTLRKTKRARGRRQGLSLLEVLIVITIMGILAVIILPRLGDRSTESKGASCDVNKGNIEVQAQLWYRDLGTWPAADLSDIGADGDHFPDGLPTCPVDGTSYQFDSATQRVVGHVH